VLTLLHQIAPACFRGTNLSPPTPCMRFPGPLSLEVLLRRLNDCRCGFSVSRAKPSGKSEHITIWDWIGEFYRKPVDNGDEQRADAGRVPDAAYKLRRTDPNRLSPFFEERQTPARQAAQRAVVGPDLRPLARHRPLFFQRDYRDVLDLAVAETPRSTQPQSITSHSSSRSCAISRSRHRHRSCPRISIRSSTRITWRRSPPATEPDRFLVHAAARTWPIRWVYDSALKLGGDFTMWPSRSQSRLGIDHHAAFNYCGHLRGPTWQQWRDFVHEGRTSRAGESSARQSNAQYGAVGVSGLAGRWRARAAAPPPIMGRPLHAARSQPARACRCRRSRFF